MNSKRGYYLIGLSILAAFGVWLLYWFSSSYWYHRVDAASITVDGRLSTRSELYRSAKGGFTVVLVEPSGTSTIFVIPPHRRYVCATSNSMFLFLYRWVYCKEANYCGVALDGSEAKADNFNAQLVTTDGTIEFTTIARQRVHITW